MGNEHKLMEDVDSPTPIKLVKFLKRGKVCSITSEPPENDLCSAWHFYPLSRGAWMISILFILNISVWGLNDII